MIEEKIVPGWYRALQRHGPRHPFLTVREPDGVERTMHLPYGLNGELDHVFYLPFSPVSMTVGDGPAHRDETDDFRLERLNPIAAYAVMGHRLLKYLRYDGTRSELARLREFNLGKSVAIVPPRGKLDELYQLIKLRMACRSLPVEHFDQWQDMHMESRRVCAGRMASERDGASVAIVVLAGGGQGPLNATMTSLQGQTRPPTRCFVVDLPGAGERSPSSVTRVGSFAEAVLLAGTSYVWLLQAGDELEPDAIETAQAYLWTNPSADCLYCDEVRRIGSVLKPLFKPDYDPVLLAAFDYVGRSRIFPTALLRQNLWEDNVAFSPVLLDGIKSERIVHIPHMLLRSGVVPRCFAIIKREKSSGNPPVSIIIPTRDNASVLKSCVTSIREKTAYPDYQIIVVDNGSQCRESLAYHSHLKREGVEVLEADMEFNYSALNNVGVEEAGGRVLAFLNDDVEVVEPGWLQELVGWAVLDEIGSVGAKLLYPDGRLQHAGVVLGLVGVAGHPWKKCDPTFSRADFRLWYPRTVSANTGACLVVEKEKFQAVGGFDEALAVAFNDVDLCLRLQDSGCRNVWTPRAVLIHHESYSRGRNDTKDKQARFLEEKTFMRRRWGHMLCDDPYYNPNLTYQVEDGGLALFPQHLRC